MQDGVLLVQIHPGDSALPVAVKVDGMTVAGTGVEMRPRGKHQRRAVR